MRAIAAWCVWLLGAWLLLAPCRAQTAGSLVYAQPAAQVDVRFGVHPGFGRIVFDLRTSPPPSLEITPGHIVVQFAEPIRLTPPNWLPPQVLAFTVMPGRAEISVAPGAEIRQAWPNGRLVLDVMAPQGRDTAGHAAARPAVARAAAAAPVVTAPAMSEPGPAGPAMKPVELPAAAPDAKPARPSAPEHAHVRANRRYPIVPPSTPPGSAAAAADPPAGGDVKVPSTATSRTRKRLAPAVVIPPAASLPATESSPEPSPRSSAGSSPGPSGLPPVRASQGDPGPPLSGVPNAAAAAAGQVATGSLAGALEPVTAASLPPPLLPPGAPVALRATVLPATSDPGLQGFSVPFDQHVAAAAFRRGSDAYVVFDQARPIDLAGLQGDPEFGASTVIVLPAATVIRLPLPPGRGIALAPAGERWSIRITPLAIPPHPIAPHLVNGRLLFTLDSPGAVVAVPDPDTGALLLVGTQRKPGQGIAAPRRTPGFTLLPSWQGIALEPFSDTLTLQPVPGGFALSASDGLSLLPRAEADAASNAALLTRRYDFPALPPAALMQRLKAQLQASAEAPPLARAPLRRIAAQTLIALGLGAEAQGLLELSTIDDPRAADDPDQIGLNAIAALLDNRLGETEGLDDPRLADSDEIALWRAVRIVMLRRAAGEDASPEAAATFAATLPLALAYPKTLRARLLPLMAETMATGGEPAAAKALFAKEPDDPDLNLARAMLAQAQGDTAAALAGYDKITLGVDRLARARAASRAVELRLSTHALDAAGAAAAYDHQLSYWRGDGREFALRLRMAELRAQAGEWRSAFALLRETATAFPADPAVLAQEKASFAAFLSGAGEHLTPLDFVAFVDENADLMPDGPPGDALAERLADRLVLLDLPTRAGLLLQKLIDHAKTPLARASFAARLAELRLGNDDAAGARAALAASDAPDLPDALTERRGLIAARADARLGNTEQAVSALSTFNNSAALSARAQILEEAKDWPRALTALSELAAQTVPPDGPLDETQRHLLLRLAAAAAAAGDAATLARLREHDLPRIAGGAEAGSGAAGDADLLRVLTEAPVTSVNDLARARTETQSAHSVAGRLAQATKPAGGATPAGVSPAGKPPAPR